MIRGLVGALIGGVVGAAIWAGIAYGTHYEIGWIAWGVGALVGFGMVMGAQQEAGVATGAVAAVIAVASVVAGKWITVAVMVDAAMGKMPALTVSLERAEVMMAFQVVEEWKGNGKALKWPAGMTEDDADTAQDFPPDLWKDVEARWNGMDEGAKEAYRAGQEESMRTGLAALKSSVREDAFKAAFSPMDILFFALAVITAFKVGSGMKRE